jgi:ribosomal protein S18 acetylase RimI-like enzyme
MTTTIRQAQAADAPVIAEFNRRLAAETENLVLDPQRLAAGVAQVLADSSKGVYYVAEIGGQIVGQVMITYEWSDWRNGNIWWLQSVYVDPACRGQGVFRRLFRYVQELAGSRPDVCSLRLYMHSDNTRARLTYESLGMHHTHYEIFELALPGRNADIRR